MEKVPLLAALPPSSRHRALWSAPEEVLDDSASDEGDEEPDASFETIVGEMVATGYVEGHPTDSIALEIKSLKFAQNKVRPPLPPSLRIVISVMSGVC
jgi:hypothetical protein